MDVVADSALKLFTAPPPSSSSPSSSSLSSSSSAYLSSSLTASGVSLQQNSISDGTKIHPITTTTNSTKRSITTSNSSYGSSSSRRRKPFFGSSLKELLLEEHQCHYCHLNPLLGIPSLASAMITFIHTHIDSKGLFRIIPAPSELHALRQCIDEDGVFPTNVSVAAVTTLFIQVS